MNRISAAEEKLGSLSKEKAELLKLLLEEESRQSQQIRPCPRSEGSGRIRCPTSWAQQRMWFMDQLEGANQAYNLQFVARLRGALDPGALQEALNSIVQRHETLRTVFVSDDGVPWQEISAKGSCHIRLVDLCRYERSEREDQLRLHKIEEAREALDLRLGPLIRARLLRMEIEEYVLIVTMHHIISDFWSSGVLLRELAELYRAYCEQTPSRLEPLPVQYADYAQWQRQWLRGEAFENQLSYWRFHLKGAALQLELPTDLPRPPVQSYRGKMFPIVLDPKLCADLRAFARRHGLTLFMVLYATWAILLSRLSGQEDVVCGTPIANRQRQEVEGLIGFFVNSLALRIRVQGDFCVREFLEAVKEVTLGAYEHQDVPFEKVVEALQPQRSLTRNPLFQVAFGLQNTPYSEPAMPGLTMVREDHIYESSMFDLHVLLRERDDGIAGNAIYATDLFALGTVERWMACFTVVLRGIVNDPNRRICELPMLPDTELHQVIELFNPTQVAYSHEDLIHELFEEQVERTPDAVALVHEGQSLTYTELNSRANQLAWHLRAKSVGPDQLVAICVERSVEMLVGLLGILKAGGAYVPMDPAYPLERLGYMLKDAAPGVLLTQGRLRERLPQTTADVIALDEDWGEIGQWRSDNLESRIAGLHSQHLAYVIYTSGSTGQPKGVMVEHRNVTRLFAATQKWFRFNEQDVWTVFHSFAFDFSVWELWGALLHGGRVVVVPYLTARSPEEFYHLLCSEGVTVLNQTPSAFGRLIEAQMRSEKKHSLRLVIFGGEALELRTLRPWVRRNGADQPQLVNMYGITETTVHVTYRPLTEEDVESQWASLIGKPIPDLKTYLLDKHRQPVPIGVTGELYVGGAGVARGYLNRPELTAKRFMPNQFSTDPQQRLYRTGDLGRWRPDGSIEYLGRNDHQVKIRGYRIELGEIEAQIYGHGAVKEVVVVARDDEHGEKRLVAYVVGDRRALREVPSSDAPEQLRSEIVSGWETVFKEAYESENEIAGPSFVGWNSSYTGLPIPEVQMQEWLAWTIERITSLQPNRVLEIGCGVGLLLQHLAPQCVVYVGTDFSAAALSRLRQWIGNRHDLQHVELLHRPATQLLDLESRRFDTVVLNSVAQYFPDIDYLLTVLQGAVRLLAPGGKIFIGDVRHLGTLPMLHSAIQLGRAAAPTNVRQLRMAVDREVAQERELVIDPLFFDLLPGRVPGISAVEIQLKRGRAPNELTRHRYDVVLHIGESMGTKPICEPIDWTTVVKSVQNLEVALQERRWSSVRLLSISNGRLAKEAAAQRLIETGDQDLLDAGGIRRHLNELPCEHVDPEVFWEFGEAHGYDVAVSWGSRDSATCFDVQLLDRARADQVPRVQSRPADTVRPWSMYATDPLEYSFRQQLISRLREHLKGRLPEYMIPSAWVALKELPLTPNGKLDRRALPAPRSRSEHMGQYVAPSTELELEVANIWAEVLRIDQVGVHDNFFELGGHSLLATRVISRVNYALDVDLPLRVMFERPTVAELSDCVIRDIAAELSMEGS